MWSWDSLWRRSSRSVHDERVMGLRTRGRGVVVREGWARLKVAMRFQKIIASVRRLHKSGK
jgi:hypothetical protein